MSISKFKQLKELAATDYLAAIDLGDILSGGVDIEGIRKNYRKALEYYLRGYALAPREYEALMMPSGLKSKLPKFNQLFEAMRMSTPKEVNRLLKNSK